MNTEEALLQAIYRNPGDDTPRFAYRDWLEEVVPVIPCPGCTRYDRGGYVPDVTPSPMAGWAVCKQCNGEAKLPNPRIEFLRLQYELEEEKPISILEELRTDGSEIDPEPNYVVRGYRDSPRAVGLRDRCRVLFDTFGREWFTHHLKDASVAVTVYTDWARIQQVFRDRPEISYLLSIRRGFPESLYCTSANFLTPGYARWFADTTPLRFVRLVDKAPQLAKHRAGGMSHRYCWWNGDKIDANMWGKNAVLPSALFPDPSRWRCNYDTKEAANQALSERCLEYARTAPVPR